jgi:hypothetical protein
MLKGSIPPLTNNTYGPSVRTGVLEIPLPPGPTPPFENSTFILSAVFSGTGGFWNGSGDTWPTTWAADNAVYGWDCDAGNGGPFSPMSFWLISNESSVGSQPQESLVGGLILVPTQISHEPIDYEMLCAQFGQTGPSPNINVKPGSVIALNDTIYTSVSCMNYGDDADFNRQHNLAGFISSSSDGGKTWANITQVGAFSGKLSSPIFVSCGQNNEPCRTLFGGVLYVFFFGSFDDGAYWDNNDALFLSKVPEASLADLSEYLYYTGQGGEGEPTWSTDQTLAQPVFTYGLMLGENAISFNPYLNRFVFANFGFLDNNGQPRPWHQEPYMMPHRTQLIFLEAKNPWGPWSIFYHSDDSPPAPGLYTPTFPSAYMNPISLSRDEDELLNVSDDDELGSASMLMFFSCLEGADNCRYTLNWQPVSLTLNMSEF